MTSYRYLGYGTTDSNGVAHLKKNASSQDVNGYVGTGAGEVDVIASLDNPISQGSIVSETLSVFDCYRHDDGTINSHNDIWTGISNTDLTREAEYTTIKEKTVGTTATITFTGVPFKNYRIECDVYQVDGTQDEWFITVLDENYTAITSADAKLGEWKHISLDLTNIAQNSRVRLNTGGSCTELRFKNFMLYPTGDNDVISINATNPVITNLGTTNITGTLFVDGVIQKNTNIDVYKNGTKVDTINTGSSGVASYTYTGSGAGKTEFQFKYGGILSEIFVVTDCEWLDDCTVSTHNTNWFNRNQLQTDYTGNVLKLTGGASSGNYMPNKEGTATSIADVTEWTPSFALELDIVDFNGASYSNIGISTVGRSLSQLGITGATHLKITYDGSTVKYYKDNSTTEIYSASLTTNPVYISIGVNSGRYVTIKDVKIYPI